MRKFGVVPNVRILKCLHQQKFFLILIHRNWNFQVLPRGHSRNSKVAHAKPLGVLAKVTLPSKYQQAKSQKTSWSAKQAPKGLPLEGSLLLSRRQKVVTKNLFDFLHGSSAKCEGSGTVASSDHLAGKTKVSVSAFEPVGSQGRRHAEIDCKSAKCQVPSPLGGRVALDTARLEDTGSVSNKVLIRICVFSQPNSRHKSGTFLQSVRLAEKHRFTKAAKKAGILLAPALLKSCRAFRERGA